MIGELVKKNGVTDRSFLRLIKLDGPISVINRKATINIVKFDDALALNDPEYDNVKCTYQSKPISCNEYGALKYGENAVNLIIDLL